MQLDNGNVCAFPSIRDFSDCYREPGLTKREYFAACASQGLLVNGTSFNNGADIAKFAVECADALIIELSK